MFATAKYGQIHGYVIANAMRILSIIVPQNSNRLANLLDDVGQLARPRRALRRDAWLTCCVETTQYKVILFRGAAFETGWKLRYHVRNLKSGTTYIVKTVLIERNDSRGHQFVWTRQDSSTKMQWALILPHIFFTNSRYKWWCWYGAQSSLLIRYSCYLQPEVSTQYELFNKCSIQMTPLAQLACNKRQQTSAVSSGQCIVIGSGMYGLTNSEEPPKNSK